MKKQSKNFIHALILICTVSFLVSCSASQKLGSSGVTINAGVGKDAKTVYACITADVEKLSIRAKHQLETWFPQMKGISEQ